MLGPSGIRSLGSVAAAGAALAISGCGGDGGGEGGIPAQAAAQLRATASTIDQATQEQSCEVAHSATTDLRGQVDALTGEVEPETYRALSEMVSSIDELLDVECPKTGTSDGEQEPPPTEPPVTPTAPTTTTPTTGEDTDEDKSDNNEDDSGKGPPDVPPGHGGAPPGQEDDPPESVPPSSGEPPTGGLDTERSENRKPKKAKGHAKPKEDSG